MKFVPFIALIVFSMILGACSTLKAQEDARQQRLASQKAAPVATPATPSGQGTGSLFDPVIKKNEPDAATLRSQASIAEAQKNAASTDLTKSATIAPGPIIVELKPILRSVADFNLVSDGYAAHVSAVDAVRISLHAFGLAKNTGGIEKVRLADVAWKKYFESMQVSVQVGGPGVEVIKAFFAKLRALDAQLDDAVNDINAFINRQRTQPSP